MCDQPIRPIMWNIESRQTCELPLFDPTSLADVPGMAFALGMAAPGRAIGRFLMVAR
jgi:hypothetical protein